MPLQDWDRDRPAIHICVDSNCEVLRDRLAKEAYIKVGHSAKGNLRHFARITACLVVDPQVSQRSRFYSVWIRVAAPEEAENSLVSSKVGLELRVVIAHEVRVSLCQCITLICQHRAIVEVNPKFACVNFLSIRGKVKNLWSSKLKTGWLCQGIGFWCLLVLVWTRAYLVVVVELKQDTFLDGFFGPHRPVLVRLGSVDKVPVPSPIILS